MRVLVLRPEPAASRTGDTLSALGHEAICLPLSQAEHDLTATRKALGEPHSAIAVTSAEIARLFGRLGGGLATTVFAVGEASAAGQKRKPRTARGFPLFQAGPPYANRS